MEDEQFDIQEPPSSLDRTSSMSSTSSCIATPQEEIRCEIHECPGTVAYPWTGDGYKKGDKKTFFLTCIGTRGDVQPIVVLAQKLMADGHTCRLACHGDHAQTVTKQGISHYPLEGFPPTETMQIPLGGSHIPPYVPLFMKRKKYKQWYKELAYSSWEAINAPNDDGTEFKPDAIITSLQATFSLDLAEKLRIPMFLYNVFPVVPTDHFRAGFSLFMDGKSDGYSLVNRASYFLFDKGLEIGVRPVERDFRKHLDLPRLRAGNRTMTTNRLARMHVPSFGIWSPNLLDAPEDWHENALVVGSVDRTGGLGNLPDDLMDYIMYFQKGDRVQIDDSGVFGVVTHNNEIEGDDRRYFVELDPTNDPSLLEFYVNYSHQPLKKSQLSHANGPKEPPVFFGFGNSMTNDSVLGKVWKEVKATVRRQEIKRCIFHVNPGFDLHHVDQDPPEGVHVLAKPVPHDVLFSYCKWVVHHGGPGTFHAAFRSGKPNCIVSMVVDHPFWGDLLVKKRIGSHVRCHKITEKALTECVKTLEEPDVVENCLALGAKLRQEVNGADTLIQQIYARFPSGPVDYLALEKEATWLKDPIIQDRLKNRRIYHKTLADSQSTTVPRSSGHSVNSISPDNIAAGG